jgi:hypothetical protein
MQEISKILNQTLKLQKLEKLGEKSSYLDLISKMRWEPFKYLETWPKINVGVFKEKIGENRNEGFEDVRPFL